MYKFVDFLNLKKLIMAEEKDTKSVEEEFWRGGERKQEDAIDPELLSLPPPPTPKSRHPLIRVVVILIGLLLIFWLRVDLAYFFSSRTPQNLGDAMELDTGKVKSNTYVHIEGFPNPSTVVRFSKRFQRGFFRMFPLVGNRKVFIQFHYKEEKEQKKKDRELPGEFTGRAIRFSDLAKTGITGSSYVNVRKFYSDSFLSEIPDDAVLIMDGESPNSYWPYALIAGIVAIFVLLNAILLILNLKKRKIKK